eukprot:6851636-Pyramimonas_sp.AAC.1
MAAKPSNSAAPRTSEKKLEGALLLASRMPMGGIRALVTVALAMRERALDHARQDAMTQKAASLSNKLLTERAPPIRGRHVDAQLGEETFYQSAIAPPGTEPTRARRPLPRGRVGARARRARLGPDGGNHLELSRSRWHEGPR